MLLFPRCFFISKRQRYKGRTGLGEIAHKYKELVTTVKGHPSAPFTVVVLETVLYVYLYLPLTLMVNSCDFVPRDFCSCNTTFLFLHGPLHFPRNYGRVRWTERKQQSKFLPSLPRGPTLRPPDPRLKRRGTKTRSQRSRHSSCPVERGCTV